MIKYFFLNLFLLMYIIKVVYNKNLIYIKYMYQKMNLQLNILLDVNKIE